VPKVHEVLDDSATLRGDRFTKDRPVVVEPSLTSSLARKIESAFGGHSWHPLASCLIYASYYAVGLLVEVAYKFDIYGNKAVIAAPFLFIWIFATSILGLTVAFRSARAEKSFGLQFSVSVFVLAAAIAFIAAWSVLPNVPVTDAKFQTYAAPAAYLKDIGYILPVALLFLVTPFHFLVVLEQEVKNGKATAVLELLARRSQGIRPTGTVYIKPWVLGLLLAGLAAYSLPARAHLFDNLLPSPYLGLFGVLHQTLTMLQFALGLYCLAWYCWALDRLKSTVKGPRVEDT